MAAVSVRSIEATAVSGVTVIIVKTASGLTVVRVVLPLTPCAEAVMMEVPALGPPTPVANPVELMVATSKSPLLNVKATPLTELPY